MYTHGGPLGVGAGGAGGTGGGQMNGHHMGGQTAADLRRQLHGIKARDREAAVFAAQASLGERFLKSNWFTGIVTGSAVGLLLYITNPAFVQTASSDSSQSQSSSGLVSPPNLKRVAAWAVLAGLLVALGPLTYQKFSSPK